MVTDVQVRALRAALTGDVDMFDQLVDVEDPAFAVVMAHAFVVAAQMRFPTGLSTAQAVRLVGRLRSRDGGQHADVDATIAEHLLLSAIRGEVVSRKLDEGAKGYVQFALLMELVSGPSEGDGQIDAVLGAARREANHWLTIHTSS
jgi:hypothetical protein